MVNDICNSIVLNLSPVLSAVENHKALVADLKKEFGQTKASLACEKKITQQLKQAVRNAKHENQLLRENTSKVVEKMKARREEFLQLISQNNQALRELRIHYAEHELTRKVQELEEKNQALQLEVHQLKEATSGDLHNELLQLKEHFAQTMTRNEALEELVNELHGKLELEQTEKIQKREEMEAAFELIAQLKDKLDQSTGVAVSGEHAARLGNLEAELAQARETVAQQKALLAEKEQVAQQTIEEFQQLDAYTNNLAAGFEQLQAYCSELELRLKGGCINYPREDDNTVGNTAPMAIDSDTLKEDVSAV